MPVASAANPRSPPASGQNEKGLSMRAAEAELRERGSNEREEDEGEQETQLVRGSVKRAVLNSHVKIEGFQGLVWWEAEG